MGLLRERGVAWPRFRYIVAGERGAVEYITLVGFPLAISYHSPQPQAGSARRQPAAISGGRSGAVQDHLALLSRCPVMSRSRSVLPRGLGRGEGKQGGGGACRILEYGCMPDAGQHFDLRAGNGAVVRGG